VGELTTIGLDIAKSVFQVHGVDARGKAVLRRQLRREQVAAFFVNLPPCLIGMEACASAHHWGRMLERFGHTARLMAPQFVKPYVKTNKNDAADAEAIAEAASRPTMRFVEVKTEEQQAHAMLFRTRQMFVRQRTQLINALRGHLAEHGVIAPQGPANIRTLASALEDESLGLPQIVRELGQLYADQIAVIGARIAALDLKMRTSARCAETTRRIQTMPGVGHVTAVALEAFAPPMNSFRRGRDFAAWLGLVPRQHSSGGKQRLGKTSKMGQRDIRRLLIIGAMSMIRATLRRGTAEGTWLARMLARKPRILVATALANKMARGLWAMMTKQEEYRDPALT